MKALERVRIIKEIVEIFEKNNLCESPEKFWIINGVASAITLLDDEIRIAFKSVDEN